MTDESKPIQDLTPAFPNSVPKTPPFDLPPTSPEKTSSETPAIRVPSWRFLAAILIQSALIVAVPFQSALTYARGETVTLQTVPVDPYDILRGYSQTLSFDISEPDALKVLPGGDEVFTWKNEGELIYVTLAAPNKADAALDVVATPTAWVPVAVSLEPPESLDAGQVALRGRYQRWRISYGLETYYMPEAQRDDINSQIGQLRGDSTRAFVVDVKVDAEGNSVPMSLWIRDQEYRF